MQFEIADDVASTFAHEFYGALADGYPIDAAVTEARKAIFAAGRETEWAIPVLYLRAPDGRIFELERPQTGGDTRGATLDNTVAAEPPEPAPEPERPAPAGVPASADAPPHAEPAQDRTAALLRRASVALAQ